MILDPKSRKAAELAETELMELVRGGEADFSLSIESQWPMGRSVHDAWDSGESD
jgi:hypothetical protein